jgi:hypothetical protein
MVFLPILYMEWLVCLRDYILERIFNIALLVYLHMREFYFWPPCFWGQVIVVYLAFSPRFPSRPALVLFGVKVPS